MKEILTELDLEKAVDLTLTETETIWLLDMPGVCCSTESEEAAALKQNNERYQEVSESLTQRDNTDNFISFFKSYPTSAQDSQPDMGVWG